MTPQLLTGVVVVPTVSGRTPLSKNVVRTTCGHVSVPRIGPLGAEEVDEVDEVDRTTELDGAADTPGTPPGSGRRASTTKGTTW